MVTGEFYTKKDLFPGFGRPFVYYANILQKFVNFTYLKHISISFDLMLIFKTVKTVLFAKGGR